MFPSCASVYNFSPEFIEWLENQPAYESACFQLLPEWRDTVDMLCTYSRVECR
jgi:hypothetical protein